MLMTINPNDVELMEDESWVETGTCCICNGIFVNGGNNPAPVKNQGWCCVACNEAVVIPYRLRLFANK